MRALGRAADAWYEALSASLAKKERLELVNALDQVPAPSPHRDEERSAQKGAPSSLVADSSLKRGADSGDFVPPG